MTKKKILLLTSIVETICLALAFGAAYYLRDDSVQSSLIFAIVMSMLSGIVTYIYLA